jgi:hypothetical protein
MLNTNNSENTVLLISAKFKESWQFQSKVMTYQEVLLTKMFILKCKTNIQCYLIIEHVIKTV